MKFILKKLFEYTCVAVFCFLAFIGAVAGYAYWVTKPLEPSATMIVKDIASGRFEALHNEIKMSDETVSLSDMSNVFSEDMLPMIHNVKTIDWNNRKFNTLSGMVVLSGDSNVVDGSGVFYRFDLVYSKLSDGNFHVSGINVEAEGLSD